MIQRNVTRMTKKRMLLLDALISIVVVLVGFNAINHFRQGNRHDVLLRSGAVTMTSDELIKHVKNEKIAAYWLGPLRGYKYAIICKDRKEIIVTYLPQGVSLNHPDRFNLTVETYARSLTSEKRGVSNLSSDRDDFVASDGTVGTVYSPKPQLVTFAVPGTDKTVEVQYPDARRIYDVYVDAERLTFISETKS
jgi:hypothetical protein